MGPSEIAVIITVVVLLGKEFINWYKSSGRNQLMNFNENVRLDREINRELKTLVDVTGANRCSIVKYHNGTETFDNFSLNYASMTHEETDDITSKLIEKFQKVPLSLFSEALLNLLKNPEKFSIVDANESEPGIMQSGWNVQRSYNFMLSDKLSNGILCVAYTQTAPDLSREKILLCKATAYKINVLLNKKG